jgi:glycosyltransferase involved in cell wall biosynthesis
MADQPAPRRRSNSRGVLLVAMYDVSGLNSAPKVQIKFISAALARQTHLETISGGRLGRAAAGLRWLASGGPRRVGAVYVEAPSASVMPTDLAFMALMRLMGRPVGVYFRDAYQLFREIYPRRYRRQVLTDLIWRVTMPLTRGLATQQFVPSDGLAKVMHLGRPILLPPGTEPGSPDLGAGHKSLVAYVGGNAWADGFDTLVDAMTIVRSAVPDAQLLAVTSPMPQERMVQLPGWVEIRQAGRAELPALLRDARLCVIPRPITEYTNLAVPLKLWDYLSMGKPVVATEATETAKIIAASGGGIVTPDTSQGLATGLLKLLEDEELAVTMAARARAFACSPDATWDARAATILEAMLGKAAA